MSLRKTYSFVLFSFLLTQKLLGKVPEPVKPKRVCKGAFYDIAALDTLDKKIAFYLSQRTSLNHDQQIELLTRLGFSFPDPWVPMEYKLGLNTKAMAAMKKLPSEHVDKILEIGLKFLKAGEIRPFEELSIPVDLLPTEEFITFIDALYKVRIDPREKGKSLEDIMREIYLYGVNLSTYACLDGVESLQRRHASLNGPNRRFPSLLPTP